jgi:hypothetical protein
VVVAASPWETIAREAAGESSLWAEALRPEGERELEAVFSPLAEERHALGLETIYEGYLLHYGRSRLFAPRDDDTALLLGDYLYAHGLVRVDGLPGDGAAWAATASTLGEGPDARAAWAADGSAQVERALEAHRRRVG